MAAPFFTTPFQPYVYHVLGLNFPDAFLCSVNVVKVSNTVNQRIRNIPDGVEGFLRQKLSGTGLAFIVAGGSAVQKLLEVGEVRAADVSCIAAVSSTVDIKIQYNTPTRRAVFGGEHQVTTVLMGPGIVFIQSLPFYRFSQRIARRVSMNEIQLYRAESAN